MMAIFELQSSDFESNPPLFVKAMLEMNFNIDDSHPSIIIEDFYSGKTRQSDSNDRPRGQHSGVHIEEETAEEMVHVIYSTPTFNIISFLHSVDFSDDDEEDATEGTKPSTDSATSDSK